MNGQLLNGDLLNQRWSIIQTLGTGGQGQTYLAKDTKLSGSPICVVKQLLPASTIDPTLSHNSKQQIWDNAHRLFDQEIKLLRELTHSQIPRLLDNFVENGQFYLVQEYIQGNTLTDEMPIGRPWSPENVNILLHEILEILEYIHCQNVIHRDIKPDNTIRRQFDRKLVLIDFGAVKQVRSSQTTTNQGIIRSTMAIGTMGYMPPEQHKGQASSSSDLYALGMISIQALTGINALQIQLDYSNPGTGEIDWHRLPFDNNNPLVQELRTVLTKMVRYRPIERYQTARENRLALPPIPVPSNSGFYVGRPQPPEVIYSPPPPPSVIYAGFWLRWAASLIDGLIFALPWFVLWLMIYGSLCSGSSCGDNDVSVTLWIANFLMIIPQWLYFAIMESSSSQATVGKIALGLIVTDINGKRISFGQASGRYFGKLLSGLFFYAGFIMAGMTAKKQALHDMMADCLVVKKQR